MATNLNQTASNFKPGFFGNNPGGQAGGTGIASANHMIKSLAHLCVFSNDLKRSLDFYVGALGLQRHFDFHKDGKLFGFYLQVAPGQFIEIFQNGADVEIKRQRIHHFCLEVDDLDALREKLLARGVAVTPKKLGCDQTWQCWCQDPDGTEVEFQQYTPQSSQFTRTNCVVDW